MTRAVKRLISQGFRFYEVKRLSLAQLVFFSLTPSEMEGIVEGIALGLKDAADPGKQLKDIKHLFPNLGPGKKVVDGYNAS